MTHFQRIFKQPNKNNITLIWGSAVFCCCERLLGLAQSPNYRLRWTQQRPVFSLDTWPGSFETGICLLPFKKGGPAGKVTHVQCHPSSLEQWSWTWAAIKVSLFSLYLATTGDPKPENACNQTRDEPQLSLSHVGFPFTASLKSWSWKDRISCPRGVTGSSHLCCDAKRGNKSGEIWQCDSLFSL